MIVVHASREFDDNAIAAPGIDRAIRRAKSEKRSVVYLVSDQSEEGYKNWYTEDRVPDYEIFSEGGEHNLPLAMNEVTVVGGFFGSYDGARGCHTLATRDIIRMHFESSTRPLTIHMPIQGIYFWDEDSLVRDSILALDPQTAPQQKLSEVFENFPRLFFLTDAWDLDEFGHRYSSKTNRAYRHGLPVNLERYSFTLLFNDRPITRFGHGPRRVTLKLENK